MPNLTIWDFDNTLTNHFTFQEYSLDRNFFAQNFQLGFSSIQNNLKHGVDLFWTHNHQNLNAIATYHNNPDFIAGFISALLKQELRLTQTDYLKDSPIAINYYEVPGNPIPFLISYIPKIGLEFNQALEQINGKNTQIQALREVFVHNNWIDPKSIVYFYDDSQINCQKAITLPGLEVYLVDAANPIFTTSEVVNDIPVLNEQPLPAADIIAPSIASMSRKQFISFFDFDLTLNNKHTFNTFCMENTMLHLVKTGVPSSMQGSIEAICNVKKDVEQYLKHDEDNISAIISSHNNPEFIAGFVSQILDKEFKLYQTSYLNYSNSPITLAVNYYSVANTNVPFLIAYIPKYNKEFTTALNALKGTGRNLQIQALKSIYLQNDWIISGAEISFYDDTKSNCDAALLLPNVHPMWVTAAAKNFTFKSLAGLVPDAAAGVELPSKRPQAISKEACFFPSQSPKWPVYQQILPDVDASFSQAPAESAAAGAGAPTFS